MNYLDILIVGALIYLLIRMRNSTCNNNKQEKFENQYPITNNEPLREKLRKELVPQLENLKTGFDTVFDSINNSLDSKQISERIGCTKREQITGAIEPNALQNELKSLVNSKKAEYQSRVDEMVRQVEQMVIQY